MLKCGVGSQRDQGFQPFADDVGVREFAFVRQDFPGGIEKRSRVEGRGLRAGICARLLLPSTLDLRLSTSQPRFQVLLKTFLRLEVVGDDDDGALGEKVVQQGGEKRLGWRR